MMEMVLTRLRDFTCKTSTFDECKAAGQSGCSRDPPSRTEGCTAGEEGRKLDIESALAWLRRELVRQELFFLHFNSSPHHCDFSSKHSTQYLNI